VLALASLTEAGTKFKTEQSEAHQNIDCRRCHRTGLSDGDINMTAVSKCRLCHLPSISTRDSGLGFHTGAKGRDCLGCHSFHETGLVKTPQGDLSLVSLKLLNADHCRACHTENGSLESLSKGHQAAARLYHEQAATLADLKPSQPCLNCHSSASANSWQAAPGRDVLEFSEHATHPFSVVVNPGKGSYAHRIRADIDPRIPLFSGRIECQSCHSLTSDTKDRLVAFDSPKDLCLGCHQFKKEAVNNPSALMATIVDR